MLCAQEIDVRNAMRSVIRVLVHYHAPASHEPDHTYLGEAQRLRSDLHAAQ
jgi:chorismate mutase